MTTLLSEDTEPSGDLVAGVATHADTHHIAVLDIAGRRLGDRQVRLLLLVARRL